MSKESEKSSLTRCSCNKRNLWQCIEENGLNTGKMCFKKSEEKKDDSEKS